MESNMFTPTTVVVILILFNKLEAEAILEDVVSEAQSGTGEDIAELYNIVGNLKSEIEVNKVQYGMRMRQIEEDLGELKEANVNLKKVLSDGEEKHNVIRVKQDSRIKQLERRVKYLEDANTELRNTVKHHEMMSRDSDLQRDKQQRKRDFRNQELTVAFTAYLDHVIDPVGQGQAIVFNSVLLNDGRGYNNVTGAFTTPMPGVYLFTFYVGQKNVNEFVVSLTVNNRHMVEAIVETIYSNQDQQGGNTAILKLNQGDIVQIKHVSKGLHLEGSDSLRVTTFSGFLLYPVETLAVVGK